MSDTAAILNEAYGLIEQGELARARTMLQPLLESDSQNPDVWWLYTHAAEDESEGRRALERVIALDPQYPGAAELGARMGITPRVLKPLKPLPTTSEPTPAPVPTTTTPVVPAPAPVLAGPADPDMDDDDFDETGRPAREGRRFPSLLMVAGVLIVLFGLAWLVLSLLNQPGTPTPTAVADLLTPGADLTVTTDSALPTTTLVDVTFAPTTAEEESFSQTATALVGTGIPTVDFNAGVVTEESSAVTVEALVNVTEESALVPTEPVAVATEESGVATSESLLPLSTQAVIPTEDVSAAVTDVIPTEDIAAVVTEAALATQDAIVTPDVVATEDMIVTPDVVVTQDVTPEASPVATEETDLILPTETAGTNVNTVPTEETGLILTAEATADPADTLAAKLESLNVTPDDIVIAETSLGPTLIVEVCAVPVASATSALVTSMNALAETIADVPDVDAVGVNLACDETRARVIAVPASTAAAYGRGEIDARTYRQGWQPTDLIEDESNG
jgi:hypothetical protein